MTNTNQVTAKMFLEAAQTKENAIRLSIAWNMFHVLKLKRKVVSEALGVSSKQVGHILDKAERIIKMATDPEKPTYYGLTIRAVNVLENAVGTKTKETIKQMLLSGELQLRRVRNCGKDTEIQIYKWAGVYEQMKYGPPPPVHRCPFCTKRLSIYRFRYKIDPSNLHSYEINKGE